MKHKTVITSLVLSGSIALAGGSLFAQTAPESDRPGGNLPGTTQPGGLGSGADRTPGQSGMGEQGKEHDKSGMNLSSEKIKEVQQALKEKGHDPGAATGVINEETRTAIREFQKANNLSVTGTLDQETAQKLGVSVSGSADTGASGASPRLEGGKSPSGSGTSGSRGMGSGRSGSQGMGSGSSSPGSDK